MLALNHLKEEGGTVLHRFGEDLEQISLVFTVYQNALRRQVLDVLVDLQTTLYQRVIIRAWHVQEFDAAPAHLGNGGGDVSGCDGAVLNALSQVIIEIFLNLRSA